MIRRRWGWSPPKPPERADDSYRELSAVGHVRNPPHRRVFFWSTGDSAGALAPATWDEMRRCAVGTFAEAVLLRVVVGEEDRHGGCVLYQAIVSRALKEKMAGATVLPALEGFGRSRYVRSELNVDAGPHLPMVVEIVDSEEQIDRFLPIVREMLESGLVTLEKVRAKRYRPRSASQEAGAA